MHWEARRRQSLLDRRTARDKQQVATGGPASRGQHAWSRYDFRYEHASCRSMGGVGGQERPQICVIEMTLNAPHPELCW
ncbi:hypothetical protein D4764_18G0001250 [Takifugu flavidus]|uniref:Uncharacterized protein n=1 Tax=Takifugu flavidus TaxID=433684 RepID=A0A5C6NRU4_9TELE|nr:hypothetical protein D4764_18G0001250 [Takifugu flavidus]